MSLLALEEGKEGKIQLINQRTEELGINVSYIEKSKEREYSEIELLITPGSVRQEDVSEQDVVNFLERLVRKDNLFKEGGNLYNPKKPRELQEFKRTLRRVNTRENIIICQVIDKQADSEKIKRVAYNYMFRPCLNYLIHMGEFS